MIFASSDVCFASAKSFGLFTKFSANKETKGGFMSILCILACVDHFNFPLKSICNQKCLTTQKYFV